MCCEILEADWPDLNPPIEERLMQNMFAHLDKAMPLMPDVSEVADATAECCDVPEELSKAAGACSHFSIHEWADPPQEPGENGTLYKEEHCAKKQGYNVVCCGGDEEYCELAQSEKLLSRNVGHIKEFGQ